MKNSRFSSNMNLTETAHIQEIIKLQLKKPKSWNWQLSTSRSSPHISLPIIQLYDAKGHLILETKDIGTEQRRSWHSGGITTANTDSSHKESNSSRHLHRCRSDTLEREPRKQDANKYESKSRKEAHRSDSNKLNNGPSRAGLDHSKLKGTCEGPIGNRKGEVQGQGAREQEVPGNRGRDVHKFRKCRSNILEGQESRLETPKRIGAEDPSTATKQKRVPYRHRRSRSDDVFQRILKRSEESLKRAETDGYRNFLASAALPGEPGVPTPGHVLLLNNGEVEQRPYKTRTSSAGTLIITEESFSKGERQRRRRDASIDNPGGRRRECGLQQAAPWRMGHSRNRYGASMMEECQSDNSRLRIIDESDKARSSPYGNPPVGLFYSKSDVFPFEGIRSHRKKYDENHNYAEKVPEWDCHPSDRTIGDKVERKKRRQSRRHCSDGSTSPEKPSRSRSRRGKSATKARVVKEHPKDGGSADLLQLVRRLSSGDHVKMGANVSRHSSKGLSGRRSQSSGSICNGKGRGHGDGKMCGSLPSYFDDETSSTGCNNNHHECEKPPLDEVQRIPPLGDGAPLHWKFSDTQTVLCDQGYGSERSPEEEYPPPLPDHDSQCHHHLEPHACYPFITPESTFLVKLTKSSRGLGLSVTGGIDSGGSWPGLIRIKRLFPYQPASSCGLLNVGDLIVEANGITLTGLTNYEALEVLRTAPNQVDLKVCRPPPDVLSCVSPISEVPPPPPRREPPASLNLLQAAVFGSPEDDHYHGEFEVTLSKTQGSLGFTLRKEDDSALGHYVRALVREPALTDGRIKAGDKIIAVNEVEISSMTHEQAVQYLRQCGDVVKLRLYRDSAQTPVAALSPTEMTPRTSFSKKTNLRQEAVDMLNDIAVRKLMSGTNDTYRSASPGGSPRRLRRPTCPSNACEPQPAEEQFHEALLQKCPHPFDDDDFSLFTIEPEDDRPSRPISLDLYNPNQTPVAARKPRFNFSLAHNAYELNNLDPEVLDAPNLTYNLGGDDVKSTEVECGDSFPKEPASMPYMPVGNSGFSHKNPAYQSAHPPCGSDAEDRTSSEKCTETEEEDGALEDEDSESTEVMMLRDETVILSIELNRGWNSRLGFSLQGAAGITYVSAIHANSVAAKDGRLMPGDRVMKVNDENVENLSTNEIIDLLRIVRGPVCIVVSRRLP